MELPPVTFPPGASGFLPPVVTATVASVLGPNRYELQVQGLLLELEAQLFLSVGDKIPLRVARQTPREIVFELARPPQNAGEERPEPARFPPETRDLVREFVRMRAPLDPALLARAAQVTRDAPTRQAAAFLAAHGFGPDPAQVEALARLVLPPLPYGESSAPAAAAPQEVAEKTGLLARAAATPLEEAVAKVLEGSPRLRVLDRLIEAVTTMSPTADAPPENLAQALQQVRSATTETLDAVLGALPPLTKEAQAELVRELQDSERRTIAGLPDLAPVKEAPARIQASDRASDLRLVNQLSRLRDDGVLALEVPVRADGRVDLIPLRIRREAGGRGRPGEGPAYAVTIEADLSRVGLVQARLDSAGKTLRVRLRVRDPRVRGHLESGAGALAEALRAQGFEASVAAELVQSLERESIFDVFAAPDGDITLDVTL